MEKITPEDVRHIAMLMDQGMTSGLFDREGYRVVWEISKDEDNYDCLKVNIFKN